MSHSTAWTGQAESSKALVWVRRKGKANQSHQPPESLEPLMEPHLLLL